MLRFLLLLVLCMVVARMFWRVVDNVVEAATGKPPGVRAGASARGSAAQSVQMARDPVCGTFVVPDKAVASIEGGARVYFCSVACRDRYRAGRAPIEGRTA